MSKNQMRALKYVAKDTMCNVETVVKNATMLEVAANQNMPIGRSIRKRLRSRR
jgi:hypothetical protein